MADSKIISDTADLVIWFTTDQMRETFDSVIAGGPDELKDYANDYIHNEYEGGLEFVDWNIAHSIIKDFNEKELFKVLMEETVKDYIDTAAA